MNTNDLVAIIMTVTLGSLCFVIWCALKYGSKDE